jgi:hypothetical protein
MVTKNNPDSISIHGACEPVYTGSSFCLKKNQPYAMIFPLQLHAQLLSISVAEPSLDYAVLSQMFFKNQGYHYPVSYLQGGAVILCGGG